MKPSDNCVAGRITSMSSDSGIVMADLPSKKPGDLKEQQRHFSKNKWREHMGQEQRIEDRKALDKLNER